MRAGSLFAFALPCLALAVFTRAWRDYGSVGEDNKVATGLWGKLIEQKVRKVKARTERLPFSQDQFSHGPKFSLTESPPKKRADVILLGLLVVFFICILSCMGVRIFKRSKTGSDNKTGGHAAAGLRARAFDMCQCSMPLPQMVGRLSKCQNAVDDTDMALAEHIQSTLAPSEVSSMVRVLRTAKDRSELKEKIESLPQYATLAAFVRNSAGFHLSDGLQHCFESLCK